MRRNDGADSSAYAYNEPAAVDFDDKEAREPGVSDRHSKDASKPGVDEEPPETNDIDKLLDDLLGVEPDKAMPEM